MSPELLPEAEWPGRSFDEIAAKTVATAVVGGTASVIGGGKFQNGAATAAFVYVFNQIATPAPGPLGILPAAKLAGDALSKALPDLLSRTADPEEWYVVRGGIARPEDLLKGTSTNPSLPPDIEGFSVQAAPGRSIDELAAQLPGSYKQISVTTVQRLLTIGVGVYLGTEGFGAYHSTVEMSPKSLDQAKKISNMFERRANPAIK